MMIMIWFCLLMSLITKGSSFLSIRYYCPNEISYSPNSTYKANLDSLLSNLYSNANRHNGFYNTTVVRSGSNDDTVYGLFFCRGDVSTEVCQNCIGDARIEILELCTNGTTAIIWFDNCMLRYSEKSIMLGLLDTSTYFTLTDKGDNDTQPNGFIQLVGNMLDQITTRASSSSGSGKKFAVLEANFSGFERVYALAQCTPDLSNADCQICFKNAIAMLLRCCYGAISARAVYPSCNVRYEIYPFYNLSAMAPPALPPLPPPPPLTMLPNSSSSKGNKGKSSAKVIIITASVVSIVTAMLLFVLCFYFLKMKRATKSHSDVKETTSENRGSSSSKVIIAIVVPITGIILLTAIFCFLRIRNAKKRHTRLQKTDMNRVSAEESSQYDFAMVKAITNDFSLKCKIGQGGYGSVYKGMLPNGQEVAVKRLSKSSRQGAQEFKNEVEVVVKLQHRNLVRLLGFFSEGEEKILIYEFVPNKSLDYFLFDVDKQYVLDWSRRYKIIGGITRGLLYLHQDSRLKIIHRDLKVSNILLDANMDPKIADFGLAKIVEVDQIEGNTNRIVGTYGYMSPEYAMHGEFSVKSDVFSLGVILLEIITGKKNRNISKGNRTVDLLGYAWEYWRDDTPLEILDPILGESYNVNEVIQCIHISLLCVQEVAVERPTMADVMLMLSSYSSNRWSAPREPAFYHGGREEILKEQSELEQSVSVNVASISQLHPR